LDYGSGTPGAKGYLPAAKAGADGVGRRPESVKWWIQRHRLVNVIPTVDTDLEVFQGEMIGWWKAINPEWRKTTDEYLPIARYSDTEGWGGLQKAGPNGFFLVMMCMAWWGRRDDTAAQPIWSTMCDDVRRALLSMSDCILAAARVDVNEEQERVITAGTKRGGGDRSTRSSKRKRF
jgi:hypothetical protein